MTNERLYNLLPAIYRIRDAEQGEALRALLSVMESELQNLDDDIAGLYDDWFVETAAEWVVPYIGDLLGVRGLHTNTGREFSLRAYVANTLAYRRRKGTASMLEQLAQDITGWGASVVEFFERLSTTQYLNHLRPHSQRTPDLRNADSLELIDTPFDQAAHTADVRHISNAGLKPLPVGKYNIPNIGIFLWRLQAYQLEQGDARPSGAGPGFYTFNPLEYDQPLFNTPRSESDPGAAFAISHLAGEINVPGQLRRRPLFSELEALRQAMAEGMDFSPAYFDLDQPVLKIYLDNSADPVPPEQVLICDLSDWRHPPATKDYTSSAGATISMPITAGVDPVLGRLALPVGAAHDPVRVSYAYGFSGDVGGGPYNRSESVFGALKGPVAWQVGVSKRVPPVAGQVFDNLADAVTAWNAQPAGTVGVIAIMDSCSYTGNLTGANAIQIPSGSQLLIAAADWPEVEDLLNPGVFVRNIGELTPDEVRPHILGNLSVRGTAPTNDPATGELALDGLLIEGRLTVLAGNLGSLAVSHCTLVPALGGLAANSGAGAGAKNAELRIRLNRSICGRVALADTIPFFAAQDSIIDRAGGGLALDIPGGDVSLQECTVFGETRARSLEASNTIFNAEVQVERRQVGCVRYSFVPYGSSTPRHYRCLPDLEFSRRAEELGLASANDLTAAERTRISLRVKPEFNSVHYGDPDYAQLSRSNEGSALSQQGSVFVKNGAEDGSEMGVFSYLKQPQREANLRASLDEYLRFGLEAGIFFIT